MSNKQLIIEFIGLPASGKSLLSQKIKEDLEENYPVEAPTEKIANKNFLRRVTTKITYSILELILHPITSSRHLKLIIKTKQKSLKDLVKVTLNLLYLSHVIRKSKKSDCITLLDQGLLQALWSISLSSKKIPKYIAREKSITELLPDLIISVKVDHQTIINRLKKRTKKQSRIEKNPNKKKEIKRTKKIFTSLKKVIPKEQTKLIKVKNNTIKQFRDSKELIKKEIIDLWIN